MRLIDADALKEKKVYSLERHEKIVPVAEIDWMPTIDAVPVVYAQWKGLSHAGTYECTHCNQVIKTKEIKNYKYCYHCGARMAFLFDDD